MPEFYIGLMSGTSVDGIDAGLVDFSAHKPKLVAFEYHPFSNSIKQKIQSVSDINTKINLKEYGELDCQLGVLFANTVNQLLNRANISHAEVTAIGSHGQTIYHAPNDIAPFSLQIGDPNIIAEKTKITTIADFRRRDIAASGQGAPLVPAFHKAMFADNNKHITVVNIGGIANITALFQHHVTAFDTGPGNTLMDYLCQKYCQKAYDHNGDWGKSGTIIPELLYLLKQTEYFKQSPPKSTGKEYFSYTWLEAKIKNFNIYEAKDIQATLCHLTAETISDSIQKYAPETEELLVCGGGTHNQNLLSLLARDNYSVNSTEKYGIHPDHVEAMAFAWLARQSFNNLAGNLHQVTGAHTPVILGGIYPGINGLG